MNKNIRALTACKYLICVILITGLAACDKKGFSYDNIVDAGATSFLITDSLTINTSTAYLDSVATSNTGIALAGTNIDPVYGKISASSYWQVRAYSGTPAVPDFFTYDSMVLMLHPHTYAYGDTSNIQHLEVYRVTDPIVTYLTNPTLYSYNSFKTEPSPIGSLVRKISPFRDSVFSVHLDDNLGQQLLNMCYQRSQTILNQTQFTTFFQGLNLRAGSASGVISSFRADDSLNIRLFYHSLVSGLQVQTFIDFPVTNPTVQFNHVDYVRPAGSLLATLNSANKLLPSTQTNSVAYVQPLTNIITRIDIPALRTFGQLHKYFKIMRATLTVRPLKASYIYPYYLPPALTLVQIDADNTVTPADSVLNPGSGGSQHGNLSIDYAMNLQTAYTYDITNYVIATMNSSDITTRSLALMPPRQSGITDFSRAILGDVYNTTNNLEIRVFYVVYH